MMNFKLYMNFHDYVVPCNDFWYYLLRINSWLQPFVIFLRARGSRIFCGGGGSRTQFYSFLKRLVAKCCDASSEEIEEGGGGEEDSDPTQ